MKQQYTYAQAAAKLGIADTTLRHWVSKGRISHQKLGRFVRFTEEDLVSAYKQVPAASGVPAGRRRR